ncbi:hypothetical protein SDC9_27501 [bioreactor metagenome]|uniref:Ubiquitin Mut7-C domain-containing protein n=1 Tax=bioreactor metagenome TaxID=1076179 RepID=A0A644US96_9ZZZZ|nr:MoaD/ThiS family protein [Negativicutes bacterium]
MVIEIWLNESLKSYMPSSPNGIVTVDVIGDITVGELLDELEIDRSFVGITLVNGKKSSLQQILYDGDKLSLFDSSKRE